MRKTESQVSNRQSDSKVTLLKYYIQETHRIKNPKNLTTDMLKHRYLSVRAS